MRLDEQLEGRRAVEVLKHGHVIVPQRQLRACLDLMRVQRARVLEVVQRCRKERREALERREHRGEAEVA